MSTTGELILCSDFRTMFEHEVDLGLYQLIVDAEQVVIDASVTKTRRLIATNKSDPFYN